MARETVESSRMTPRLESWKEIAAYLGRDDRTAKRWEKTRGLPVHRLPGVRSGVFAFPHEIERWRRASAGESELVAEAAETSTAGRENRGTEGWTEKQPRSLALHLSLLVAILLLIAGSWWALHRPPAQPVRPQTMASTPAKSPAYTPSKDVEELYLSGRYYWNRRTPADLRTALALFRKAIERDPRYAAAYIGIADTEFLLVEYASLPPREAYPPAIAAAKRAIELAPTMPEAHRSLGFTSFYWSWDRKMAESEFRRAIALDPRDATTHHWLANILMTDTRYAEALAEIDAARKLDPTTISILADRAHILAAMGRNDEAAHELHNIERADPAFIPAHWYLADLYSSQEDDANYVRELKEAAALSHRGSDSEIAAAAEKGLASGKHEGMLRALADVKISLYARGQVDAFDAANALALAGRKQEAVQYLKLAYQHRDTQFLTLIDQRSLPMLRSDAEFLELASKSVGPYDEQAEIADLVTSLPEHARR